MGRKTLVLASIIALAIGGSLLAAPSISRADPVTIYHVVVNVGGHTWCDTASSCNSPIWALGAGVLLPGGGTGGALILTQTSGFNLDSSERNGGAACIAPATPCTTTLSVDITNNAINDPTLVATTSNVLANNNGDTLGEHNEAHNWESAGVSADIGPAHVYFGYADNAHRDACADGGDCLPSSGTTRPGNLWAGSANTVFIGAGTTYGGSNKCGASGAADCFDAGAILFYNTQPVPEPITMFLGGTGLLLLAYAARRRLFAR